MLAAREVLVRLAMPHLNSKVWYCLVKYPPAQATEQIKIPALTLSKKDRGSWITQPRSHFMVLTGALGYGAPGNG